MKTKIHITKTFLIFILMFGVESLKAQLPDKGKCKIEIYLLKNYVKPSTDTAAYLAEIMANLEDTVLVRDEAITALSIQKVIRKFGMFKKYISYDYSLHFAKATEGKIVILVKALNSGSIFGKQFSILVNGNTFLTGSFKSPYISAVPKTTSAYINMDTVTNEISLRFGRTNKPPSNIHILTDCFASRSTLQYPKTIKVYYTRKGFFRRSKD